MRFGIILGINILGINGRADEEQVTGRLLQVSSPEIAIYRSNVLGLSMSAVFVVLMLVICRLSATARKSSTLAVSNKANESR